MAVANTLAYYDTATIMAAKSFIVQAPGKKTTTTTHKIQNLKCEKKCF
jgi:hypothetical protein